MPRFSLSSLQRAARNPRIVIRVVLGLLLAANLVAALFVVKPWTGSAADLERQAASLRQ